MAVAFALLGAQSCASSFQRSDKTDTGIISYSDSNVDNGFNREDGDNKDSHITQPDSGRDAGATIDQDTSEDATSCPETVVWQESDVVDDSLHNNACAELREGCEISVSAIYPTNARMILDESGDVIDIQSNASDHDPLTPELKSCYLTALKGQRFPCLKEKNQYWIFCGVLLA